MRQGWESEAQNWLVFTRTPGYDSSHEETNVPVLLDLLPRPPSRANRTGRWTLRAARAA